MVYQLRTNRTLRELIAGAFLYCVLLEIPLLIFTEKKLYHTTGLASGFIICVVLAAMMADSIDLAVDLDEKSARAYLQKQASLRYAIACISILAVAFTHTGNPLTFFAGVMGLKIGAYIQPFTHAAICRMRGETEAARNPASDTQEAGEQENKGPDTNIQETGSSEVN